MIPTTLVFGPSVSAREKKISTVLRTDIAAALILEGFPEGKESLNLHENFSQISIERIASGCMCCTGNLIMRVTLNRVIRTRPQQIFISLASNEHEESIRNFLLQAPYDKLLFLTDNLYG